MPRRNELPREQRLREGAILKAKVLEYREKQGLSHDEFAHEVGISPAFLSNMYAGRKQIPNDWLIDLALQIGCDAREIRPEITEYARKILAAMGVSEMEAVIKSRTSTVDEQALVRAVYHLADILASEKKE